MTMRRAWKLKSLRTSAGTEHGMKGGRSEPTFTHTVTEHREHGVTRKSLRTSAGKERGQKGERSEARL